MGPGVRDVLVFIGGGEATPADVAAALGVVPKLAGMMLARLHRAGDLDREEFGKSFLYRLSAQAIRRLSEDAPANVDGGRGRGDNDPSWNELAAFTSSITEIQSLSSRIDDVRRRRDEPDRARLEAEAAAARRQQRQQLEERRQALIRAGLAAAHRRMKAAGVGAFTRWDADQVLERELARQVVGHEAEQDVEVLAVSIAERSVAAVAGERHREDPDAPADAKT